MKSKSTNKAIKGRRNRCHAQHDPLILVRYDRYDEKKRREIEDLLSQSTYAMIPKEVDFEIVNIIPAKRPRFIS